MDIVARIILTVGLLVAALLAISCGGASSPTAPPPSGAANGLNTLLYIYSDT